MDYIRYVIALWAAKLSIIALRITRHNGTNFPGIVALKLCPSFLKYAKKPEKILAVTGTNGKTTCSNLITDILRLDNKKVLNNSAGSNIDTGIATALVQGMNIFGVERYEIGVFEVDERSAKRVFPFLKPEYILITNLSRDSIMRNAHPEYIADFLSANIPDESILILNADDLISSRVSPLNRRIYYGVERMDGDVRECKNLINDFQICPICSRKLEYEYLRYNHIGRAYCRSCDFKAPDYDYTAFNVDVEGKTFEIKSRGEAGRYRLISDSIFNIYNQVSVIALLSELGYSREKIKAFFERVNLVESRFEEERFGDKTLYRMLAKEKNAFATTRVFDYISGMPGDKEIILMNSCQGDMKHWSENTCWLYDCDFEFLNRENIRNIVLCGPRRLDHKLRLLLAGVDEERLSFAEKETETPDRLKYFDNDNIYVLYGTDSLELGMRVADMVKSRLEEGCENA